MTDEEKRRDLARRLHRLAEELEALGRPARDDAPVTRCQGCGVPIYPLPESGLCTDCLAQ